MPERPHADYRPMQKIDEPRPLFAGVQGTGGAGASEAADRGPVIFDRIVNAFVEFEGSIAPMNSAGRALAWPLMCPLSEIPIIYLPASQWAALFFPRLVAKSFYFIFLVFRVRTRGRVAPL